MKPIITTIALILLAAPGVAVERNYQEAARILSTIESGGNHHKTGDGGRAEGTYQIWRIRVDECNRIVGLRRWTYADRRNPHESRHMLETYLAWCDQRHPNDGTVKWLSRWRNPKGNAPKWYQRKIRNCLLAADKSRPVADSLPSAS
jgi:hypothetical protein